MSERRFIIREVKDDYNYDVIENELMRRLNIICDEMHSPKKSIEILLHGEAEKEEKNV